MSAMSQLHAKVEDFKSKLSAEAAHLVAEFESLAHELLGQGVADGEQLATEAETAAKPVEQAAEQDADTLAQTAVAEVKADVPTSAPSAPSSTSPSA